MPFLSFLRSKTEDKSPLLERCLSVDLEVDPKKAEIFDLLPCVMVQVRPLFRVREG
jgi:ATP-dependent DNA helicase RecQ